MDYFQDLADPLQLAQKVFFYDFGVYTQGNYVSELQNTAYLQILEEIVDIEQGIIALVVFLKC